MKFQCPMLVVSDLERSKRFYMDVLKARVIRDFGANVTFSGPFALQTQETWRGFTGMDSAALRYGGNDAELYFEEDDFDGFVRHLQSFPEVECVHGAVEHDWGQRAIRFYDPDRHIIEVGEDMKVVIRRLLGQGLSVEEVSGRTMYPVRFVEKCLDE